MSSLPLRPLFFRRKAIRIGLAVVVLLGAALTLGASRPRTPDGVTVCGVSDADMLASRDAFFARHPVHGGITSARAVTATFMASNFMFDSDGSSLTQVDTVRINEGESVQFTWVNGIHTTTSGLASDFNQGSLWNLPLDSTHKTQVVAFNTAGTYDFFCQNHTLNNMRGIIVVKTPAGVGPSTRAGAGFVAPPAPNPFRGAVAVRFAVAQPGRAQVTAFDAGGRAVATLFDRDVSPGTYSAAWTGRSGSGGRLAPGAYFLRLVAPGIRDTRRVTLVQ